MNMKKTEINENVKTESSPMIITDNMGREKFWEDIGRIEDDNA